MNISIYTVESNIATIWTLPVSRDEPNYQYWPFRATTYTYTQNPENIPAKPWNSISHNITWISVKLVIHQFKLFASIEWCRSFHWECWLRHCSCMNVLNLNLSASSPFCYSRVIICKQCGLSWKSGSVFTVSDRKVLGTRGRRMHLKTSTICCCLLGMLYFSQRTAAS